MSTTAPQESEFVTPAKRDRYLAFLIVTLFLNIISFVLFPMFATDAATPMQLLLCLAPISWGFFTLFAFRTRKERIVGYVSIVGSALWGLGAASLAWENGWSWMW